MTAADETPAVPDEDHSTGTAWRRPEPARPCTPKEQDQHWADLGEVVSSWRVGDAGRPRYDRRRRR
ncbi:hypothetical protein [Streptomyces albogriseolus]|uniref:hypothetical protein n=1 Tax=Streptomyces albogriseolus TaxID=1887 RepID=UPI003806F712